MAVTIQVKGITFIFREPAVGGKRIALVVLNRMTEEDGHTSYTQVDVHYSRNVPGAPDDLTKTYNFRGPHNTVQHISKAIIGTIYGKRHPQASAIDRLGQMLSVVA